MKTMPTVENAANWFNAKTVTHHLDVVDRQAALIVDTRTAEGSTVRIYNADGFEFMTLKSDNVSTRFDSLFGEKLVGARHAEDGRLYAILEDDDCTREEPVGLFPFADVRVGPKPARRAPHNGGGGGVRSGDCDGDPALFRGRSRLPALSMTRKKGDKMIGTKYTSELLAAFAELPRLCRMNVKVAPDGREIAFYSRRYAGGGSCATTVFDADDRELATYEEIADLDDVRFGFAVDQCIAKVAVRKHAVSDALQAVFNVHGADPDSVKVESVVLPADSVVELDVAVSEYGFTSAVEWLHTKSNVFISFYENATSDDPWLRIVEPA